jgi:uncharacterized membrane protein
MTAATSAADAHDADASDAMAPARSCPACGGSNDADAVFCANPACGKALGEFRYVREELDAGRRWHESVAERVTAFVGRPHYVVAHTLWFAAWIAVNTAGAAAMRAFDQYPFSLLGILLSIEAIFITGFVLISQNRQAAHADKRAELDYEVNVRTYREIGEIRDALRALQRQLAHLERRGEPSAP